MFTGVKTVHSVRESLCANELFFILKHVKGFHLGLGF